MLSSTGSSSLFLKKGLRTLKGGHTPVHAPTTSTMAAFSATEGSAFSKKYEGSIKKVLFYTFCACIGAFNFGYTIGFSSPAIPNMVNTGMLLKEDAGWFGSLMTVGAVLGGPVAGWCIEKLGRKRTIFMSSLPFLFGYGLLIFARGTLYLFGGRFLTGVGSGMITVCVPMYVAEIATKSRRGVLGSCVQLFIVIGICFAYIVGMYKEWKEMAVVAYVPALLSAVVALFLPETPRWLLTRNRKVDAKQALVALRDSHVDVEDELTDIEDGLDTKNEMSWSEFFSRPELKRPLFISIMIMIFQQLSGINAVMFYTVSIFNTAIPDFAHAATVVVGFVQVIATLIACLLMDHTGRKKLLIIAGLIMTVTLGIFGLYYKLLAAKMLPELLSKWLPVACLTCFIIGFSLGWGPIPMLIMSEIFPVQGRGTAGGIAIFSNWITAFFVTKEFMTLQVILGEDGVFYFFSTCCAVSVWFVWKFLPETKGKSLEDIELYFHARGATKV